jgi:hypothetical protein
LLSVGPWQQLIDIAVGVIIDDAREDVGQTFHKLRGELSTSTDAARRPAAIIGAAHGEPRPACRRVPLGAGLLRLRPYRRPSSTRRTRPFGGIALHGIDFVARQAKQRYYARKSGGSDGRNPLVYYAFDLLWRDGDLRKLPQLERKQLLADLIGENEIDMPVLYSEHLNGDGQQMFDHAPKLGWKGIIRARWPYRSERPRPGQNQNVLARQFPVIGFVKDPTGVAALYLGKQEGKELVDKGKVGTGWSRTVFSQLRSSSIPW